MAFHPIRRVKRALHNTRRRVAAFIMVLASAGGGSTVVAPDSAPAQLSNDAVRVVHSVVDKFVG